MQLSTGADETDLVRVQRAGRRVADEVLLPALFFVPPAIAICRGVHEQHLLLTELFEFKELFVRYVHKRCVRFLQDQCQVVDSETQATGLQESRASCVGIAQELQYFPRIRMMPRHCSLAQRLQRRCVSCDTLCLFPVPHKRHCFAYGAMTSLKDPLTLRRV